MRSKRISGQKGTLQRDEGVRLQAFRNSRCAYVLMRLGGCKDTCQTNKGETFKSSGCALALKEGAVL